MIKNLFKTLGAFLFLILASAALLYATAIPKAAQEQNGTVLVMLNEIRQQSGAENNPQLSAAICGLQEQLSASDTSYAEHYVQRVTLAFIGLGACFLILLLLYVYVRILRPFHTLQQYAAEIAGGNLDLPLDLERTNFFGEFTWAFDHMREEIRHAKAKERAAISENKTVIAALSHDIKTPIASIRAYSEALEANLSADYAKRQRYLQTIMRKCDEVTALVNDLVLHSLSELEKLEIHTEPLSIAEVIRETVSELEFAQLQLVEPLPNATVTADPRRVAQIIENLLNNARKYAAGCSVRIFAELTPQYYRIHVQDAGNGILPEDMPFILQKFYRGSNTADQPGSGLGLYIVNYLSQAMNGELCLNTSRDGLDVVVSLPLTFFDS